MEVTVIPRLFPSIDWFSRLAPGTTPVLDLSRHWDKRDKNTHRYSVADVNGIVQLTVPVEKPSSFTNATLADIRLSSHGQWWHVHRVTLESGYGRTPWFEHYFPSLAKFFCNTTVENYPFLWQYIDATTKVIMELLQLQEYDRWMQENNIKRGHFKTYRQIRQDNLGFISGLSILDLLFNIGPQSAIYIRENFEI